MRMRIIYIRIIYARKYNIHNIKGTVFAVPRDACAEDQLIVALFVSRMVHF